MSVSPTTDTLVMEDSSTSESQDVNDAEISSSSETPEESKSTFDMLQDVLNGDADKDGEDERGSEEDDDSDSDGDSGDNPDGSEKDKEKSEGEASDNDDSDEPSDEELKTMKVKTRKRFEKLQNTTRELKEQLQGAEQEASHYRQFTSYLESNRITQDEANELFEIGALMKNDPNKALQLIAPHYNRLLQATGNVLPPELVEQVQNGYITKEAAFEISRSRASGQMTQSIAQEQTQHQAQQAARQQQEQVGSVQSAMAAWENKWSTSDPDYKQKKDLVLEQVELSLVRAQRAGTSPKTVEDAIRLANEAKAKVEKQFKQANQKKSIKSVDGGGSNSSLPAPKTTFDVMNRVLGQSS